ncbi:hypothetical protein ACOMHN_007647 [Nucella lapillus]
MDRNDFTNDLTNDLTNDRNKGEALLREEIEALNGHVQQKWNYLQVPSVPLWNGGDDVPEAPKDARYDFVLGEYPLKDVHSLCKALREDMEDPSSFDAALLEMPQKRVCMMLMLAKCGQFEAAHSAVNEILSQARFESGRLGSWSRTFEKILSQHFATWYEFPENSLDYVLSVLIHKQQDCDKFNTQLFTIFHILDTLIYKFRWPEGCLDVINFKDANQKTLLHWLVGEGRDKGFSHALFLLKLGADVNIPGPSGQTVIQKLVEGKLGWSDKSNIDFLVYMVENAGRIDQHRWKSSISSALHLLCEYGHYQHIPLFINKGADVQTLLRGNTLINTLVHSVRITLDVKEKFLALLLDSSFNLGPYHLALLLDSSFNLGPYHLALLLDSSFNLGPYHLALLLDSSFNLGLYHLALLLDSSFNLGLYHLALLLDSSFNLGPYHADIVAKRSPAGMRMDLKLYPVVYLLFPPLSTKALQRSHLKIIKMLVDGGAVSDRELLAVKPHLPKVSQDNNLEAVEYLQPLIKALQPDDSV